MMTNLFSVFDPATSTLLSLNWISMLLIIFLPNSYWNNLNKILTIKQIVIKSLAKEIIMHTKSTKMTLLFVSMFMYLLFNNMFGLLPYVFTAPAHMSFSLSIALGLWMSLMLFGWINKTNSMFSHLVPVGTPPILMPFMVLIESISNIMRPGSLAVRLTANMVAGHLLMSLLGNNMSSSILMMIMMWLFMGLMLFELAVAFIQSYVFMTLSTLYYSEI